MFVLPEEHCVALSCLTNQLSVIATQVSREFDFFLQICEDS